MKVENLVSWAGLDFSYVGGEILDLDDEVAEARIAAGLARLPVVEPEAVVEPKRRAKQA